MRRFTTDQLMNMAARRSDGSGTIEDEIAALSKGDPRIFDSYMDMPRLQMWKIAIGGM